MYSDKLFMKLTKAKKKKIAKILGARGTPRPTKQHPWAYPALPSGRRKINRDEKIAQVLLEENKKALIKHLLTGGKADTFKPKTVAERRRELWLEKDNAEVINRNDGGKWVKFNK